MEGNKKHIGRILVVAPKPPYPSVDGGAIAEANMMHMLASIAGHVEYFCLSTPKHTYYPGKFDHKYPANLTMYSQFVNTSIKPAHLFRVLFGSGSYRTSRFFDEDASERLADLLRQNTYDLIWIESVYGAVYMDMIRELTPARVVLRTHNIEYKIWEPVIDQQSNFIKRFLLNQENQKLKRFEQHLFRVVDGVVSISPKDSRQTRSIKGHAPEIYIPFAVNVNSEKPVHKREQSSKLRLFHIGAMDWQPNIDAMKWFLEKIFPAMLKANSNLEFHMAGKSMGEPFRSWKAPGVIVHGEVEDAEQFMLENDILVVPLKSGSGIRIKILEAMGFGIPVITTGLGLSGIDARDGEEIIVADQLEDWVRYAGRLREFRPWVQKIGEQGRIRVLEDYNLEQLRSKLQSFILNLIR